MDTYNQPDKNGFFGEYGGSFVPEQLKKSLQTLTNEYVKARNDSQFLSELRSLYRMYANRPSLLYYAKNLTEYAGGAKIYLKREDLNHTGAHKINNALGQALIAKRLGKKKLIAETGAGQHGVAVATVAALFGMECDIYMGKRDIEHEKPNVYRMKILGAHVVEVTQGQQTLKDAVDAALMAYVTDPTVYYLLGSVVGPHPYPVMVRDFQKIIGEEIKEQMMHKEKKLPDYVVACVGGGSNAMGAFYEFINDIDTKLIAVEPAGKGELTKKHGISLGKGTVDIIHGFKTLILHDENGTICESYSAASGLDYPGVGPELSYLKSIKRIELASVTDEEAIQAFSLLSKKEGIIPALESAHAISYGVQLAKKLEKDKTVVINLSGRGDKDVEFIYKEYVSK
ncbi:MAG: tryptophan synthase subunit beta [Candidatus Roizmanbacteria bacterium]|nr:tryptophan synthase subunit beta [Candidatus Roizmanbacteria bacterium]